MTGEAFDIAIVGAGVVGCAIAREFSRYDCRTILLEAKSDIGDGASKGNSAVLSTGADTPFGTLECRLVARGHERYRTEARALGLPFLEIGSLTVAWTQEEASRLEAMHAETLAAGFIGGRIVGPAEIYAKAPELARGAHAAIWDPEEGIVDPFSTPVAYALDAVANGVEFRHDSPIVAAQRTPDGWVLRTPSQSIGTRLVVNCAGLWADRVESLAGYADFVGRPRRGQFVVFDKSARSLLDVVIKPVPTPAYRGVLVTPTVFGNILVGPTAEEIDDPEDWRTTREGIESLMAAARRILPALVGHEVTATYCGVRPGTDRPEYRIIPRAGDSWIAVGGIRSTGLSGALGISEYVADQVRDMGFPLSRKRQPLREIHVPDLSSHAARPWEGGADVDPAAAEIVCHCEGTTIRQVRDALASPIPPRSLKALKRRTRVTFGRCQGFYCGARAQELLDKAAGAQKP